MKNRKLTITLVGFFAALSFSCWGQTQPPGGGNGAEGEYEQGQVKKRSKSAHKKEDKINKHNDKAREKSNEAAEKNRKEKLSKQKKKNDEHEFKF